MDLIATIEDLIKFRTETGNAAEIAKAAEYIRQKFTDTDVIASVFQTTASPVVFLRNTETLDFDVVVLGHIDVVPAADEMFNPVIKDGKMYTLNVRELCSQARKAEIDYEP